MAHRHSELPAGCEQWPIVFVVSDSFGFCRGALGWRNYYDDLARSFFASGFLLYAVIADGATAVDGSYRELVDDLVVEVGRLPDFVVVISMGNDLLHCVTYPFSLRVHDPHLAAVCRELCLLPRRLPGARFGLLYGGSSALFGYVHDAARYDDAVARVVDHVRPHYDFVDTLDALAPLVTIDGIGHISDSEVDRVLAHMSVAIARGFNLLLSRRSRL